MKESRNISNISNLKSQLSCGEIICGRVTIDASNSSSNNNTNIKQYISMINDEMNNLLKQTKTNVDAIELDSKTL